MVKENEIKSRIKFETKKFKFQMCFLKDNFFFLEMYEKEESPTKCKEPEKAEEIVKEYLEPLGKWETLTNPLGLLCKDIGLSHNFREKFITNGKEWKIQFKPKPEIGVDVFVLTPNLSTRVRREEFKANSDGIINCIKNLDKWYALIKNKEFLEKLIG
jgi:hypothetical protein